MVYSIASVCASATRNWFIYTPNPRRTSSAHAMHLLSTSPSFKEMERRFRQWKKQLVVLGNWWSITSLWWPSGGSETTFFIDDHHDAAAVVLQKRVVRTTPPLVGRQEFNLLHLLKNTNTITIYILMSRNEAGFWSSLNTSTRPRNLCRDEEDSQENLIKIAINRLVRTGGTFLVEICMSQSTRAMSSCW